MKAPDSPATSASVWRLGVAAGVVTGLGEVANLAFRKYGRHRFAFENADVIWLTPASEAVFFAVFGLCLLAMARLRRREVPLAWLAGGYAFLGSISALLTYAAIHRAAAFVLALGVGVQVGRFVRGSRGDRLVRLARLAWAPLLAIPILSAGAVRGQRSLAERKALAGLPAAPPSSPNVLLIVLDTVRSENLSLYGYERATTPSLERWARGGVRFERSVSTASWTLPSHASMFTGRLPRELSTDWFKPLDDTWPTLAEVLGARGYVTGGFVANVAYCTREVGLARGFTRYEDHVVSPERFVQSAVVLKKLAPSRFTRTRKGASEVNREFLDWVAVRRGRPFFAFLNYIDAHGPYWAPEPYASRFLLPGERRMPEPERRRGSTPRWTRAELQPVVDAYDGAISYLDAQVGALFAELERRSLLSNTLVILTSDHGEEFGEHGMIYHGYSLYRPSVQVPLVLALPGVVPAGLVVTEPVSLRDLPATVMDLLRAGPSTTFPGRSLGRFWRGDPAERASDPIVSEVGYAARLPAWYPVSKGAMRSVVAEGLRYIRNGDGHQELYDFEGDPAERRDLGASPELAKALERLRDMAEHYH